MTDTMDKLNSAKQRDVDLSHSQYHAEDISGLLADNVKFTESDFSECNLENSHLTACDLTNTNYSKANLSNTIFRMCNFDSVSATNAYCEGTVIEDSIAQGADFSGANLTRTSLTETNFARSSFKQAILDNAEGDGVKFRGADLTNTSLVGANFMDADFRGADLTGANLSGGDFSGADFRGAILDNTILANAILDGALFDGVGTESQVETSNTDGVETATAHDESADGVTIAESFSELVNSAIAGSAKGSLNLQHEMEKLARQWNGWRSQTGSVGTADLSAILNSFDTQFKDSNIIPPEAIKTFSGLLQSLETAGDETPADAWQVILEKLLPDGLETENGINLGAIAEAMQSSLSGDKDKS